MKTKLDKFLEEIKELQDKYLMYITPEYREDWDEDIDGNMYSCGVHPYLSVRDEETGAEYDVLDDFSTIMALKF